jgi:hypothetical protein
MNTFAVEIFDDTGTHCTFYTVRWDNSELSETDKFFTKYEDHEEFGDSLMEMASFLNQVIANEYGALDDFFRFENAAQALPPKGRYQIGEFLLNFFNFPLRLYCLKITENILVLLNGNEKTGLTAQSGKTSMAFHNANEFAKRITKALYDGTIIISANNRQLLNYDYSTEILL